MPDALVKAANRLQKFFQDFVSVLERFFNVSFSGDSKEKRRSRSSNNNRKWNRRSLDDFTQEIERLFTGHLTTKNLLSMSKQIRTQLHTCAKTSPFCMLPSYNHALPTGKEKGTFLALDVGGSNFRVALVQLSGGDQEMKILRMASSHIDEAAKLLKGKEFFDWMAQKIQEMLDRGPEKFGRDDAPLRMGLSWSFPVDQISVRSGRLISMGKGFHCSDGTVGEDLRELIMDACRARNLNVTMEAIVNDGSATLLSRAYADTTTRVSLILGTGTNAAVHYPVHAIGIDKYGERPAEWFAEADHVIVNTELSMFGGGVLTKTRWDEHLNNHHIKPDYQPLEYMCTGRYLGEIARLIIVEAVQTAGLFGGELPSSMKSEYSFDTAIMSCFEEDSSPSLETASAFLRKHHQFQVPPTSTDLIFLQRVSRCVSRRAAAYMATAIHSLWCERNDNETPVLPATPESIAKDGKEDIKVKPCDPVSLQVNIACDGTVINKYPGFRDNCQNYLHQLTLDGETAVPPSPAASDSAIKVKQATSSIEQLPSISLDYAPESAILGAAVAVAISGPPN